MQLVLPFQLSLPTCVDFVAFCINSNYKTERFVNLMYSIYNALCVESACKINLFIICSTLSTHLILH